MRIRILAMVLGVSAMVMLTGCSTASAQGGPAFGTQGTVGGDAVVQPLTKPEVWVGGAPAYAKVPRGSNGETVVGVWLEVPQSAQSTDRPPMALSLVVDTSGSMDGAKIQNARHAASTLLESLVDGDIVSLYAFSNAATPLVTPTVVGPGTRASLSQAVQRLYASGGTNMYAGTQTALNALATAPQSHTLRRLIMISDGRANVGPSDTASLSSLAAQGTEWGVQISAIGVGTDYDEQTLAALAVRTSGRVYHLAHPAQMASILAEELGLLQRTVATNAIIEIHPAPGIIIIGSDTMGVEVRNGRAYVRVGSLFAGQRKEALLRVRVNTGATGSFALGRVQLGYTDPVSRAPQQQQATVGYQVTESQREATQSAVPRVGTMIASENAAKAQLAAANMLNSGQQQAAVATLQRVERDLEGAARRSRSSAERRRLKKQVESVRAARMGAGRASTPAAQRSTALEAAAGAMDSMGY